MVTNIKKDIIFWIDTGSDKEVLKNNIIKENHTEEAFNEAFNQMTEDKTITLGKKSNFVVVNKFMPNTAEKLSKE